jgi:phage-related protein
VAWSFVFVNAEAKRELDALPMDMRARFERIVGLVQALGLERVREPHIKHLEGPLWEMRLRGRSGIARVLYAAAAGQRIVILRTFMKKTQKTPRLEIEIANREHGNRYDPKNDPCRGILCPMAQGPGIYGNL